VLRRVYGPKRGDVEGGWRKLQNVEHYKLYECVSKSFRTGSPERELQMVQLFATKCSCIAILLVSLVSFAAIILCAASQRVIPRVGLYFVMT
jgi:hypothetical protein